MEALALKNEAKNLIDTLDYNQTEKAVSYLRLLNQNEKPSLKDFRKYWGKLDLDIDLDTLRGRNDPR